MRESIDILSFYTAMYIFIRAHGFFFVLFMKHNTVLIICNGLP